MAPGPDLPVSNDHPADRKIPFGAQYRDFVRKLTRRTREMGLLRMLISEVSGDIFAKIGELPDRELGGVWVGWVIWANFRRCGRWRDMYIFNLHGAQPLRYVAS